MYIEEALNIIKKDTDIFLKIPYKNDYIYISYSKEDNLFFYCNEFGENNCKFKDGYNYVLLGILVDNNIALNNFELKYKSQDAFDKYWNNLIYFRGKTNKPAYDLHFLSEGPYIDFQKKISFYTLQPFERNKDEYGPIRTLKDGHVYIIMENKNV